MSDETNIEAIIQLNQIILDAQRIIQNGGSMREVWNALYVPPEVKYVSSQVEHVHRGRGNNG